MARLSLHSTVLRNLAVLLCGLACWSVLTPVALAQHGGHVGGGGMPHVSAPAASHSPSAAARPAKAPAAGKSTPSSSLRLPVRPVRPVPPVYPIYGYYGYPFYFGNPFFYGFGLGWGFDSCWWADCDLFWGWGAGGNGLGPYGYGYTPGNYVSAPTYGPSYAYPQGYGGGDQPQLYLKDGTAYTVTDYWLVDDQLHFTVREEGKPVEHAIPFDALDLQRTIDVARQRGFLFVLRDEPVEPYMQHHPEITPNKE